MRRIPIIPTILVAAAVAVMIGLGIWQLQRAEWKEKLIARLEESDAYRPRSLACTVNAKPEVRAGRNVHGETGYRYLVPCEYVEGNSPGLQGVMLDIGWSKQPDLLPHVRESRVFTGIAAGGEEGAPPIVVLDEPIPPLQASGRPMSADLPNNHLFYALQWFFFALAAAIIYLLALRRRPELPERS